MKATHQYTETKERFTPVRIKFHVTADILEKAICHQLFYNERDTLITQATTVKIVKHRLYTSGAIYFKLLFNDEDNPGMDALQPKAKELCQQLFPGFYY